MLRLLSEILGVSSVSYGIGILLITEVAGEITVCWVFSPQFCWDSVSGKGLWCMGWGGKGGLSSGCNCLEPIESEEFSFSDIREESDSTDVTIVVGIELLFEADTYLGSIRIFLKVLELGSISEALVSGGIGGFVEGVPSVVDAGGEGVTTVT